MSPLSRSSYITYCIIAAAITVGNWVFAITLHHWFPLLAILMPLATFVLLTRAIKPELANEKEHVFANLTFGVIGFLLGIANWRLMGGKWPW